VLLFFMLHGSGRSHERTMKEPSVAHGVVSQLRIRKQKMKSGSATVLNQHRLTEPVALSLHWCCDICPLVHQCRKAAV
jgi:hypothetical protein